MIPRIPLVFSHAIRRCEISKNFLGLSSITKYRFPSLLVKSCEPQVVTKSLAGALEKRRPERFATRLSSIVISPSLCFNSSFLHHSAFASLSHPSPYFYNPPSVVYYHFMDESKEFPASAHPPSCIQFQTCNTNSLKKRYFSRYNTLSDDCISDGQNWAPKANVSSRESGECDDIIEQQSSTSLSTEDGKSEVSTLSNTVIAGALSSEDFLKKIPGTGENAKDGVYVIVFTCEVCSTRSAKKFSKHSYHHGVVLVRCSGCKKLHLISDQLGWFGDNPMNIEQILKEAGQSVLKTLTDEKLLDIELTSY